MILAAQPRRSILFIQLDFQLKIGIFSARLLIFSNCHQLLETTLPQVSYFPVSYFDFITKSEQKIFGLDAGCSLDVCDVPHNVFSLEG
jgi:hypothetical protein